MTIGLVLAALVLLQIRPVSLVVVMVVTLLLDFGVQSTQVINMAQIYSLDEAAHSRVNTMFTTIQFIGGAIGTQVGVICWSRGGLGAVGWQLTLGAALAMIAALYSVRFSSTRSLA
jgi:predicted MFS family arabinose efflux permease